MTVIWIVLGVLIGLLVLVEIFLRLRFGLGNPPLYLPDVRMGYRLAPNQRVKRAGNILEINQFSMRSPVITPQRPADTLRVLLLGDSIANGGWWTAQAQTVSQLLQNELSARLEGQFAQVEVLNASANSWGPRNELGYLLRFGTFEAQTILVLLNTDDLFAYAPTSVQVGRDRNYPCHKPPLALVEAAERLRPYRPHPAIEAMIQAPGDRVGGNLEALRQMQVITQDAGSQLLLAMTPLLREVEQPGPRDYEIAARQRLLTFTETAQIPYFDFLERFQQAPYPQILYRDHIHLSPSGNQLVSQQLSAFVIAHQSVGTGEPLRLTGGEEGEDLWL